MTQAQAQGNQLRLLQLKLSNRDAQLLGERQQREELQAQLQKASENNKALARHNTRLLQLVDNFKRENELAVHELNTRAAAFKVCGQESARQIFQLQLRIKQLTAQLEAQTALVVLPGIELQPCEPGKLSGRPSDSSITGGWAGECQGLQQDSFLVHADSLQLQQDSFLVCADSAGSADQGSVQPSACGRPACAHPCPQEDSFLPCADSATCTTQHLSCSTQHAAGLADSADSGKGQLLALQCQDSFTLHADASCSSSACSGASSEEDCFEQQEQRLPPSHILRLPKTVRLLAHRAAISCPQPLQPVDGPAQQGRQVLQAMAESPGAGESQGSNNPEAADGMCSGDFGPEAEEPLSNGRSPDSSDRESGIRGYQRAPNTLQQEDGMLAEAEAKVESSAEDSLELSQTGLRSSGRTRRRVSYALPNLRTKLRQGDSFTFGDPSAVSTKPRARTKPTPRFRQPAPGAGVAIPAALQEEAELTF